MKGDVVSALVEFLRARWDEADEECEGAGEYTSCRDLSDLRHREIEAKRQDGVMSDYSAGGLIPGPHEGPRVWARGICPLDGYQLVETEPEPPKTESIWEHVIPSAEIPAMPQALARIAEAHGFEVTAAAEDILRARP